MRLFILCLIIVACSFTWADNNSMNPYEHLDGIAPSKSDDPTNALVVGTYMGSNFFLQNTGSRRLLEQYFDTSQIFDLMSQFFAITGPFTGRGPSTQTYSINQASDLNTANFWYSEDDFLQNSAFVIDIENATIVNGTNAINMQGQSFHSFTNQTLNFDGQDYSVLGAMNYSPIIIDLNGNGKADVNRNEWLPHAPKFYKERTALFDIDADGITEYLEWLGPEDGLLVMPESDLTVKDGTNLFGTAGGYKDGYQKMTLTLDSDKNGWIEGEELAGLYIWQDKNGNAKVDEGEMKPIADFKVEKLSTRHKKFESECYIDGQKVKTWDWWPAGMKLIKHAK